MAVPLGDWESPGARRRRKRFEEDRKRALNAIQPTAVAQGRNAFGLDARADALRRIDIAGRTPQSPALAAQQAAFGAGMQPTPLGAGMLPQPPGPLNPPAMIARPGDPGPFPFQGGRNPLELASAASSFIGGLPLPGGPITLTPSARGGRPGATLSVPQQQTVSQVAEFERSVFQPVTKPAGRFVAEEAVRQQPGLRIADVATGGRVSEIAGDVGATVAGELLLPTNLIPIPIIDPLLARALGLAARAGTKVTRSVLQRLSQQAGEIAVREGDTVLGTAARIFQDDAARLVQERPVVGAAAEPPRGAGRPATELVQGEPGVYEGFRAAPVGSKGTQEGGTFISSTREGGEAFQLASRRGVAEGGEVLHRVIIRTDKPFVMTDENATLLARWSIEDIPNRARTTITDADVEALADLFRRSPLQIETPDTWDTLRNRGYDAIVIKPSDGKLGDVIIGLEPRKIDMIPQRGAEPGVPTVSEPSPKGTVERLTEALEEARPALRETKQLRREEMARRAARLSAGLEQAQTGEAAQRRSLAALKGEMPTADFQPVRESIPPQEVDDLKVMIRDFYVAQPRNRRIASAQTFVALDKALDGSLPSRSDLILLEKVFGPEMVIALRNKRPILGRLGEEALAAISLWRAFITGGEQSIVLRQAVIPAINPLNARMTGRNVVSSLRAGVSEKQAIAIHEVWQATPEWERLDDAANRAGYRLFTKWHGAADPLAKEETFSLLEHTFVGRTARKTPLLGQYLNFSERGAVTFLNGTRLELGSRYLRAVDNAIERGSDAEVARLAENYGFKTVDKNGRSIPMNRLRQLLRTEGEEDVARTMAVFTGRGKLPAGDVAKLTSRALFSGMLQASRIQTPFLVLQKNPAVRKLVAQDIATFMGMGLSLLAAAHYSGAASVELDPRSSDFAKIKVGPIRIDPWGGFQQYVKLIAQMVTGQRKVALGDIQELNRIEAFARFWDNKLAPAFSLASDVIVGETALGEPVEATLGTVKREAFNRLLPLITQDVVDAFREMGAWGGAIAAPLAWFGVGVQSYTPRAVQIAQQIGEDLQRGDLGVNPDGSVISYEEVPLRRNDLVPSDQVRFDQLHPDILQESLDRERRSERGRFTLQRMEELELPALAERIVAGERQLLVGFFERYIDLRSDRALVAQLEFEGVKFPDPNTEAGRLLDEYFSLRPEDFSDEETGERDFGAFFDARDSVLDKLAELDQEVVTAIRNRPILDVAGDENLNAIEQEVLKAMGIRDQLRDISPIQGVTVEKWRDLQDFWRDVKELRDNADLAGVDIELTTAIRRMAEAQNRDLAFTALAVSLRAGTTTRAELRNPEYDTFLLQHYDELWPFYRDDLYGTDHMRQLLSVFLRVRENRAPVPAQ